MMLSKATRALVLKNRRVLSAFSDVTIRSFHMEKKITPSGPMSRQQLSSVSFNDHKDTDDLPDYLRGVPDYMAKIYWWAYLHPNAVRVFERQWLINAILFGCYEKLRSAAVSALVNKNDKIEGSLLQVACVYGNLTELISKQMAPGASSYNVVDVSPVQIANLKRKLGEASTVSLSHCNGANLCFPNQSFDQILYFFLLHEVPEDVRVRILSEAARVLKKDGGRIVFIDYHKPTSGWHPHRYLMPLVYKALEPFAPDLWEHDIDHWMPQDFRDSCTIEKDLFFGGLYQRVIVTRKKEES